MNRLFAHLLGLLATLLIPLSAQAQTPFSSWENSMNDWVDQSTGVYTYTYSATGATVGATSLACTRQSASSTTDWLIVLKNDTAAIRSAIVACNQIKLDVSTSAFPEGTTARVLLV
jgi:hypothetical protein